MEQDEEDMKMCAGKALNLDTGCNLKYKDYTEKYRPNSIARE